jgi:transposase-like protein
MNQAAVKIKPRRKYDREFKRQTVEHWLNSGKTAVEIGRELGVNPTRLYSWRDRLAPKLPGQGAHPSTTEQLEAENAQLRRDNEALRQQRDILKKTLGILSEPPNNGINGSRP